MKQKLILISMVLFLMLPSSTFADTESILNYDQQLQEFTGAVSMIYPDNSMLLQDVYTYQEALVMITDDTYYSRGVDQTFSVGNYVTVGYDQILNDGLVMQVRANTVTYNDPIPPRDKMPVISGKIIDIQDNTLYINNHIFGRQLLATFDNKTTFTPGVTSDFKVGNFVSFEADNIQTETAPPTVHARNFIYNDPQIPQFDKTYIAAGMKSVNSYYHPDNLLLSHHISDVSNDYKNVDFYNLKNKTTVYYVQIDSTSFEPLLINYYPVDPPATLGISRNQSDKIAKSFVEKSPLNEVLLSVDYTSTEYSEDYSNVTAYYYMVTYMSDEGQIIAATLIVDPYYGQVISIYGQLPLYN